MSSPFYASVLFITKENTQILEILFSVMTNELLIEWRLRTKFVDDTTALEIIPRNWMSLTNIVADNVNA